MPLLPVKHQVQTQAAGCLAACAHMILVYLEEPRSQAWLNHLFGTTSIGVPLSRIQRLQQHDFQVLIESGDETRLKNAVDQNTPPIVFVRTGQLSYWSSDVQHAVLVVGYNDSHFLVNDPVFDDAPQQIELNEFMLAWVEFDYKYVLVSK